MACSVLLTRNTFPDPQVLKIDNYTSVSDLVTAHFDNRDAVMQVIVKNNHSPTTTMCPFLHIYMDRYNSKTPVNHHMVRVLRICGIDTVNPRCHTALIVGVSAFDATLASPVDIPVELVSSFSSGITRNDIDASTTYGEKLYGLDSIYIPNALPLDIHWKIMSYLSTPTAAIIRTEMNRINLYWATHFIDLVWEYVHGRYW